MNQLMMGFKISQLRQAFTDPVVWKKQQELKAEKAERAKAKSITKSVGIKDDFMKLDNLKEDTDEQQKKMQNEDMENPKLLGTFKEAFELVLLIEA